MSNKTVLGFGLVTSVLAGVTMYNWRVGLVLAGIFYSIVGVILIVDGATD